MKGKISIFFLLAAVSLTANAEVFKCKNAAGKIIYQPEACSPGTATQAVIKVKETTPEEAEAAKAKLNAWQEQQAIEEAIKKEEYKERQAELERQERLQLERRSVTAQERQAATAQQPQYNRPLYIPAYDFNRYRRNSRLNPPYGGWGHPYPNPHDRWTPNQPIQTDAYPPYKPYVAPPPPPFRSSSIPPRNNPPNMPGPGFDNRQYDGR
jgi:Domain of unknown function (DUF4124)